MLPSKGKITEDMIKMLLNWPRAPRPKARVEAGMEDYGFYVLDGPPGIGKEFTAGAFNPVLRDCGRVVLMMLNEGRANGRQIVPTQWVTESTTPGPGSEKKRWLE